MKQKIVEYKITLSHKTPRFKWFGLISLHSLVETTQRKFTIKMWGTKKTTQTQKPQYTQISIHT
jgi:hypothetical protein